MQEVTMPLGVFGFLLFGFGVSLTLAIAGFFIIMHKAEHTGDK